MKTVKRIEKKYRNEFFINHTLIHWMKEKQCAVFSVSCFIPLNENRCKLQAKMFCYTLINFQMYILLDELGNGCSRYEKKPVMVNRSLKQTVSCAVE